MDDDPNGLRKNAVYPRGQSGIIGKNGPDSRDDRAAAGPKAMNIGACLSPCDPAAAAVARRGSTVKRGCDLKSDLRPPREHALEEPIVELGGTKI